MATKPTLSDFRTTFPQLATINDAIVIAAIEQADVLAGGAANDGVPLFAAAHFAVMLTTADASPDGGIMDVTSFSVQDHKRSGKGMADTSQDVFWTQSYYGRTYITLRDADPVYNSPQVY